MWNGWKIGVLGTTNGYEMIMYGKLEFQALPTDIKDSKGFAWIMQGFSDFLEHMELKIKKYELVLGFDSKLQNSKCDINDYQEHARINKDST